MANMKLIGAIIAGAIAGGTTLACGLWESHQAKKEEKNRIKFLDELDSLMKEVNEEFISGRFDERSADDQVKALEAFIDRTRGIDEAAKKLLDPSTCGAIMCKTMELRLKLSACLNELKMHNVAASWAETFGKESGD